MALEKTEVTSICEVGTAYFICIRRDVEKKGNGTNLCSELKIFKGQTTQMNTGDSIIFLERVTGDQIIVSFLSLAIKRIL